MELYKTEIVIWSNFNPDSVELEDLARDATDGGSYCSKQRVYFVLDAEKDEDWDGTEFFYGGE